MATKPTTTWFSGVGNGLKKRSLVFDANKKKTNNNSSNNNRSSIPRQNNKLNLNILAFETAKTMSRLLTIHKSLSDDQVQKLHNEVVALEGIAFLISTNHDFLLNLACMEKMEELDLVAAGVARLGRNCTEPDLIIFERVYADMKLGLIELGSNYSKDNSQKTMDKMEKFVSATANLYSALECLSGMEMSERKIKQWKTSGPLPTKANCNLFDEKISWQRQKVRHFRQISLWSQSFNKAVRLMARAVCIVYARMCVVFAPYMMIKACTWPKHTRVTSLPDIELRGISKLERRGVIISKSGPIQLSWREMTNGNNGVRGGSELLQQAGPSTNGGSGLTLRYANVVLVLEKYLNSRSAIDGSGREELYHMLPESVRRLVKSKLKKFNRKEMEEVQNGDDSLAEGWKEGLKRIMVWLAPMAHATIRWQMERNVEKQNFDPKPKVLLLQTLFYADREKAEAAIAEVLVGLSCICKCEIRSS